MLGVCMYVCTHHTYFTVALSVYFVDGGDAAARLAGGGGDHCLWQFHEGELADAWYTYTEGALLEGPRFWYLLSQQVVETLQEPLRLEICGAQDLARI